MKNALVRDYMNSPVIAISPKASLADALFLMERNSIRRLPVVQEGDMVGIVTWGDVREAEPSDALIFSTPERQDLLNKLEVQKFMTLQPLVTVRDDATIAQAAGLMLKHKVGGLPVVNADRQPVGIITESDIFRMVVKEWQKE